MENLRYVHRLSGNAQEKRLGRHFRLSDTLKIIVGRHEVDNNLLEHYTEGRWTAEVRDYGGPLVVIDGEPTAEQCQLIAQLTVKFTKAKHADQVIVDFIRDNEQHAVTITPDNQLDPLQWRIG